MIHNKSGATRVLSAGAALLAVVVVALAALVVGVYMPQIDQQTSQIADQKEQLEAQQHQIEDLNSTVSHLNDQIADLQGKLAQYTATLVTELGVKDLVDDNTGGRYLYVRGDVRNTGVTTAYNAGLHIVGYDVNHQVLIDLVASAGYGVYQNGFVSDTSFTQILPTQSQTVMISIYHSGTVVSWEITPVYTNMP